MCMCARTFLISLSVCVYCISMLYHKPPLGAILSELLALTLIQHFQ